MFPDRGGHTDPQQLASARAQAGVYEHAMRLAVDALGLADDIDIATRRLPRLHLAGLQLTVDPRERGPHLPGDPS